MLLTPARAIFLYSSSDCVINEQYHNGSADGDGNAIEVQPRYSRQTEETGQPSADDRSHDSENDVHDESFTGSVDDLASDKARNQAEHNPCDVRHSCAPPYKGRTPV